MKTKQKTTKGANGVGNPSSSQRPSFFLPATVTMLLLLLFPFCVLAKVAPVAVRVPEATAWVGQRVAFFVELRALGSFAGTARFALPQLSGTMLMKIGNPVVSSQEIAGSSWFVQTHEFALFSQKTGPLHVPAFAVHFASRTGFTGPAKEVQAQAPGWKAEIRRPPGSDGIGFLITAESLNITETWEPQPGPAQVGAIFKRTIVQRAPQIPGMALAAAAFTAPEEIRVYPGDVEIKDQLERGDFLGERCETITYMLQKPGTLTLPALTYAWWNPKTEALQSKTLPAVTFEVVPRSAAGTTRSAGASERAWLLLPAAVLVMALGLWQGRRFAGWGRKFWKTVNPPDRVAGRKLLRACRRHDAAMAGAAWIAWGNLQDISFQPPSELRSAVRDMQRHLYGPGPVIPWQGDALARAFGESLSAVKTGSSRESASILPLLNPQG